MKFDKFKEILINIDPNGYGDHEVNENFKMNLIKTISLDMTDRKNSWIKMLKSIDNLI